MYQGNFDIAEVLNVSAFTIDLIILCSQETDDPSAVLWYEEIQNTVDVANQQASEGEKSEHNRSLKVTQIVKVAI